MFKNDEVSFTTTFERNGVSRTTKYKGKVEGNTIKGKTERASAELAEARRLAADGRYSSIARLKAAGTVGGPGYWGVPKVRALFEATYFAGLRKAGVPEG